MPPARYHFLIAWLLLGSLAAAVCSLVWPGAHIGNEVIPVGNDSFYHARRILDTVADPSTFSEFDSKIHVPEGSRVVWPWGYDYAMARLVSLGLLFGISQRPIAILVWLPVVAVFASVGLSLLIARRLGLSLPLCIVAALAVVLSPLTQYLHGVGNIDHHFAEYMLVLATVWCGLRWFETRASHSAAALLGLILGCAPAVHNALFILQIPVVLTLLLSWWQGRAMPAATTATFGACLLAATTAILIPSQPFRAGMFEFYLLSWFHLYIAAGTALCGAFFSRCAATYRSAAMLLGIALLLLVPLTYQILLAEAFLTGSIERLSGIGEMMSPLAIARMDGAMAISTRYSALFWLLPLTLGYCLYQVWNDRQSFRSFYWISCVLGISLLTMQFRMHYFGSFALCVPGLLALQQLMAQRPQARKVLTLAGSLVMLLLFIPPLRYQLLERTPPANDPSFVDIHASLLVLRDACREDPGVVLADHDVGHYIRYYTECSVIVNNFLLTPLHEAKIREMEQLLATPAAELPARNTSVKYVLMRPAVVAMTEQGLAYRSYSARPDPLFWDVLLKPHGHPRQLLPAAYQLLHEATTASGEANLQVPYVALYKIRRDSQQQASVTGGH